jgi:hypothetical protein
MRVGNAVSSAPRSLNPEPLTRVVLFDGCDGAMQGQRNLVALKKLRALL